MNCLTSLLCLFIFCFYPVSSNKLTYLLIEVGRLPGIYRLESSGAWSRQSMLSSSSQLRSARSSLSSRISHYLPTIHGGSARSSITSPFYLPTPFSTRSNSPNNGAVGEVSDVPYCTYRTSTVRNLLFISQSNSLKTI